MVSEVTAAAVGDGVGRRPVPAQMGISPLRALAAAAALFGLVEVVLQRIGGPVSAHLAVGWRPLAGMVRVGGDFAAGATAALVVVLAAGLGWWLLAAHRAAAGLTWAAGVATLVTLLAPGPATRLLLGVGVVAAVAVLAGRHRGSAWGRAALLAVAVAVGAGHWPLVAESAGAAAGVAGARTLAELALVVAALLAAATVLGRRPVGRPAVWGAIGGGALAACALTARLETAAMASLWSVGATLALPAAAYVLASAAAGLVAVSWWGDPERRLRLAGAALLVVAGIQPAAVHHSLTAVLAVLLLSIPVREVP